MSEPTTPEVKKPEFKPDPRMKCIYENKVRLKNLSTGVTREFTLVHYESEKLKENHISNYTPIGKAIWAKHEGEEALVIEGPDAGRYLIEKIENA